MSRIRALVVLLSLACTRPWGAGAADPEPAALTLETPAFQLRLAPDARWVELTDRRAHVTWGTARRDTGLGSAQIVVGGRARRIPLSGGVARREGRALVASFQPDPEQPRLTLDLRFEPTDSDTAVECRHVAAAGLTVESLRLLDGLLRIDAPEKGYALVPVREGLLIPSEAGPAFEHRFDTYAYEGCHLAMAGFVKSGAALLATWTDPYVALDLRRSAATNAPGAASSLAGSLVLRKTATSLRLHTLGPGDYHALGAAYRQVAEARGWRVPWDRKLAGNPGRARLFGASNFKLWSLLDRRMNEDGTREESVRVNWTFAEASDVAVHLKNDLELDRVLFLMGGWIRRGYDNQHPDILPSAPECGGDAAFAEACRRIREQGYVLGLHDNYQDIYRDAPSWNEDLVMKTADGRLAGGGAWAGGRAYLTCARTALDLARRPQNLPAVRALTRADAYFIDTTYAAGLQECFDPRHPLDRSDDLKWKQALSDYARELFGIFGSECGREWAIPHADFFEGLAGVSGRHFHDENLLRKTGGVVVPFFEMVYRDTVVVHGKYGYAPERAADYVLHHLVIGRPLHYHAVPPHRYWTAPAAESEPLAIRPTLASIVAPENRRMQLVYRWHVERAPTADWRVFVHFVDTAGNIRFQDDHAPAVPTSRWTPGQLDIGPRDVVVPAGLSGRYGIRIGLFQPGSGRRAVFDGADPEEQSDLLGHVILGATGLAGFEPPAARDPGQRNGPDRGIFVRARGGWAEGRHPFDRFLKNTHEILSPLHETTARQLLSRHEFVSADRRIQRSVFGTGAEATTVTVNGSEQEFRHRSPSGGEVILPPYGFLVEGSGFVAFHARSWNGLVYSEPVLFTLRALDGAPLSEARQIGIYHGFGDDRVVMRGTTLRVPRALRWVPPAELR